MCVSLYMYLFASQLSDAITYLLRTKKRLKSHPRPSQMPNKAERDTDRVAMFVPPASCLQASRTPHPSMPHTLPPFLPKTNRQVLACPSPPYFISRFTPPHSLTGIIICRTFCVVQCQLFYCACACVCVQYIVSNI